MMTQNCLELRGVGKSYGSFALRDVDLSVPKGCIMGLVGQNGAGKTTLLKLILNLIARDSGEISVLGMDNRKEEMAIKQRLGVVMDESAFHDFLTPQKVSNIMAGIYPNWDEGQFAGYLQRFGLRPGDLIKNFSRGMKAKLSIAAALSHAPQLLLLDEPTSGLDPVVRDEILDIFAEFIGDGEHSILISSHITSDLERVADYIALLDGGQLIFCEEKDALLYGYSVLKGTREQLERLDRSELIGLRETSFGFDALVERSEENRRRFEGLVFDRCTLEEMVLYFIRGKKR
ncbi:ABC transporter ATP-binding protein [bacterium 210820-DFI.6.52]|uniref:ABC-2 type transport system ATP-binding protein n=2 Tax=Bittarella massiliensis (ex Durand et al. 2017) TaxID=1720313 RepID=A0AAQ1RVB4_9FIRM|nr:MULTISPECIES: ABC transporter ATP-binding protein [Eubacteriales]ERI97495.1 ABC transporter, ATP-binding protein [Clostridium sp. ATCC 29733]MCB5941745.1 ABC transporter ATP-binding protein [bacterium 210820-DFI.6.52]SHF83692.1 ABC-2 type transport system ATP-binding protein [Bittarella massiliensis (ex Durand et al. 2017)]